MEKSCRAFFCNFVSQQNKTYESEHFVAVPKNLRSKLLQIERQQWFISAHSHPGGSIGGPVASVMCNVMRRFMGTFLIIMKWSMKK